MFYIEKPNTCKAANRKCAEIQEFVDKFKNCLIADELSRDAMIKEIRHKVEQLNDAYPRTKKLEVRFNYFRDYLTCTPVERNSDSDTVFFITFHPVRRTYRFAENANILQEGGEL